MAQAGLDSRGAIKAITASDHDFRVVIVSRRLSLTAIAAESGFYDLPHLDKAFRHRLGVSPLEFRQRYNARARRRAHSPVRAAAGA